MGEKKQCNQCKKKFLNDYWLERHKEESHPYEPDQDKRKGWFIAGSFVDFREPVTMEHAREVVMQIQSKLAQKGTPHE